MTEKCPESYWADTAAAQRVLEAEAEALRAMAQQLDPVAIGRAVDKILQCPAQAVLTGMGKSGHIAAKIAATFASTGTPAFFLHPGEALHGDLGMLTPQNVVVALSQSGSTDEVVHLLPFIKRLGVPLIAITGNAKSTLAKKADVVILTSIDQEACPLNLAPTTSTTVQLAVGDALAVALMMRRGFTPDDFAIRHPLGALGRRLLIRVKDLMHTGDANPVISENAPLRKAIGEMTGKRLGAVSVVDEEGRMTGIFCDGDLRRLFERSSGAVNVDQPIRDFMIHSPKFTTPDILGAKAVDLMETHKITVLPVLDESRRPVGMIHLHDLIRAGITP